MPKAVARTSRSSFDPIPISTFRRSECCPKKVSGCPVLFVPEWVRVFLKRRMCDSVRPAKVVSGRELVGKVFRVCIDPRCEVHRMTPSVPRRAAKIRKARR